MAEDLVRIVPDDDDDRATPRLRQSLEAPPYQSRFQLLFGVLLGVALAAVVATVLFTAGGKQVGRRRRRHLGGVASDRQGRRSQAVNQIAEHVGQRYTLPSGNQLVGVRGGPLELARLPVTIAMQDPGQGADLRRAGRHVQLLRARQELLDQGGQALGRAPAGAAAASRSSWRSTRSATSATSTRSS